MFGKFSNQIFLEFFFPTDVIFYLLLCRRRCYFIKEIYFSRANNEQNKAKIASTEASCNLNGCAIKIKLNFPIWQLQLVRNQFSIFLINEFNYIFWMLAVFKGSGNCVPILLNQHVLSKLQILDSYRRRGRSSLFARFVNHCMLFIQFLEKVTHTRQLKIKKLRTPRELQLYKS